MRGLQEAYVLWTKGHGWSNKWFQVPGSHDLTELLDLSFSVPCAQLLVINSYDDGGHDLYGVINIIVLFPSRLRQL